MKKILKFIGLFLICGLIILPVGCRMLDLGGIEEQVLNAPPVTGSANVQFKIVVPEAAGSIGSGVLPSTAIRAAVGSAKVTFRLIIVNAGNTQNPTSILIKTVSVSTAGVAEATFSGIPAQTVIGEITIEGGNIGGKADFHGAADLTTGQNVLEVAPKGCGYRADIVANVVKAIINNSDLIGNSTSNLASKIESAGIGLISSPTTTVYTDVLDKFVTNNLNQATFTKISISDDRQTLIGSGGASWTRSIAEISNNSGTVGAMIFRKVLKQGFGSFVYVSWSNIDGSVFGISKVNTTDGSLMKYVINPGNCLQSMLLPDNSLLVGGTLGGLPLIFRWSGEDNYTFDAQNTANFTKKWAHSFTELITNSAIPTAAVEYLEYESRDSGVITCMVRDPQSKLTKLYKVDPATGAPTALEVAETFYAWARSGESEVTIGWDSVPGIATYTLYWATSESLTTASYSGKIASVQSPYHHIDRKNGVTYYYIVTYTNTQGQESTASNRVQATPIVAVVPMGFSKIAAGGAVSYAIKNDGSLWAWGCNGRGQLGNGTTTNSLTPIQVSRLTNVSMVAAGGPSGYEPVVALKNDGTVWTWGSNESGQLGDGTTNNCKIPAQVAGLSNVTGVYATRYAVFAVKNDGTAWGMGQNEWSQLGDGTTANRSSPTQVASLSDVKMVAPGEYYTAFLKNDGTVWESGNLATGNRKAEPARIPGLNGIISICTGQNFTMALKNDGTVWSWDGTTCNPTQNASLTGVIGIAAGYFSAFTLKNDGTVWCWGWNANGQLGDGTTNDSSIPVQVKGLSGVVAIAAGIDHVLAQMADGSIKSWGGNGNGQLGNGTTTNGKTPALISFQTPNAPSIPANTKIVPMTSRNIITWEGISATSYNLYWSTTPGVTKANGNKIAGVNSPFKHTGLTNGTLYYYALTSVGAGGESVETAEMAAMPGTVYSKKEGGGWYDPAAWVGGLVPDETDSVYIDGSIRLDGLATCTSVFVATGSALYGPNGSLFVNGDIVNEGSIYYACGGYDARMFRVELKGNFVQKSWYDVEYTEFSSDNEQTITVAAGKTLRGTYYDTTPASAIRAESDIDVVNFSMNFLNTTTASGTFNMGGRLLNNTSGVFKVVNGKVTNVGGFSSNDTHNYIVEGNWFQSPPGGSTILTGIVACQGNVIFEGNVELASGAELRNPSYSYSCGGSDVAVKGNFTNKGSVYTSYGEGTPYVYLSIEGDLTQNGTYAADRTTFTGSAVKTISVGAGKSINKPLYVSDPAGKLKAGSDLTFSGSSIEFTNGSQENCTLDMNNFGIFNVSGPFKVVNGKVTNITRLDSNGTGNYIGTETWFISPPGGMLTLTGVIGCQKVTFEGDVTLASGSQLANPSYAYSLGSADIYFKGNFTNKGNLYFNYDVGLHTYVYIYGDFNQSGDYSPAATYFTGANTQMLTTGSGKFLRGEFYDNNPLSALKAGGDLSVDNFHLQLSDTENATGTLDMDGYGLNVSGGTYTVLGGSPAFNAKWGKVTNISKIAVSGDVNNSAQMRDSWFVATAPADINSKIILEGFCRFGSTMRFEGNVILTTGSTLTNTGWYFIGPTVRVYITGGFSNYGTVKFSDADTSPTLVVYVSGAQYFPAP